MRRVTRSILILFSLAFFTATSAQLPPKVIADKYRIQLEQRLEKENYYRVLNRLEKILVRQKKLLKEKRYITALKVMEKIIALQKKRDFILPDEFHFQYAQVAFSTGLFQTAVDAAKKYLATVGEKGTFYKEALALLKKVEQAKKIVPIEPEMVMIPSGHFLQIDLYSVNIDTFSQSENEVIFIHAFALSKYEVTFEEYTLFTDATGRERVSDNGQDLDRFPVTNITREDAEAYTMWLSEQTGESYRLPSDEEWEYAARAGSTRVYSWWLDDIDNREESNDWNGALPVGSFSANKWGLHDMVYNVSEWTQHSVCGSSWMTAPKLLTGGPFCVGYSSKPRYGFIGFRVARSF